MNKIEQLKKEFDSYIDQITELRKKASDTKKEINKEILKEHNITVGTIMTNYKGEKFIITTVDVLYVKCNKFKKDGTLYKRSVAHDPSTIVETWKVVGHTDL